MTAVDLRTRLTQLTAERLDATEGGLEGNAVYMDALEDEISAVRRVYTMLAVTEIASLRGQLTGAAVG
jgi:hypothetical protein